MQVGVVGRNKHWSQVYILYSHPTAPARPLLCQTAHHELIGAEHGVVSAGGEIGAVII